MQPEPVSPELVLVDPELARRERARLEEKAYLREVLDIAALRSALEAELAPAEETSRRRGGWREIATFSRRRLVPAALLCSLLANGFLVADLVARKGEEATQVAVRIATASTLTAQSNSTASTGGPPTTRSATKATMKAAVERRVVSLILSAPSRKLPRDFVDPATGLVKNNVQVVCTKRKPRSFLCAVRLASDGATRALFVRYRMLDESHGVFRWYGYRNR